MSKLPSPEHRIQSRRGPVKSPDELEDHDHIRDKQDSNQRQKCQLAFSLSPELVRLGRDYICLWLEFGAESVDGWLARLATSESGIQPDEVLEPANREVLLDGCELRCPRSSAASSTAHISAGQGNQPGGAHREGVGPLLPGGKQRRRRPDPIAAPEVRAEGLGDRDGPGNRIPAGEVSGQRRRRRAGGVSE